MEYFKITQGNTPVLHIQLLKAVIGKEMQTLKHLDVASYTDLHVVLRGFQGVDTELAWEYVEDSVNEIKAQLPASLECGPYGVEITCQYNGITLTSRERHVLNIVPFNRHTSIPLGVLDGEIGGMLNAKYWLDINNEEQQSADYKVKVKVEPSSLKYDKKEHAVTITWEVLDKDSIPVVPDALSITIAGEETELDPSTAQYYTTVTETGTYSYVVKATIEGVTYQGVARVTVGAPGAVSYYGVSAATTVDELLTEGLDSLTKVDGTLESAGTITTNYVEGKLRAWFVSSVKLSSILCQGIAESINAVNQEERDGQYFYWQKKDYKAGTSVSWKCS